MKNQTILVTGGTTGIGLATAQLLSAEGAKVIVTGRNPKTLADAKAQLPANAVVLKSDSASLADAQALGAEIKKITPKLDGAFLNAGIAQFAPIDATTPQHYDDMFNVNVRGVYFQLQSLLPLLANPSSVVMNASVVARTGMANTSIYSATKAAVASFGRTLANELAPRGIRVNTLSPGPIKTPIFGKMGATAEATDETEKYLASRTLLKRLGTPEEVARLARFLLSSDSSNITGTDILVDGGVSLG
jgi:NAD(P)-dependent dehydrogenase (short-subunit alcohol dehydrogenase family)